MPNEYEKEIIEKCGTLTYHRLDVYREREELVHKYAFAIPNHQAILTIVNTTNKVIEIGAGSGYWAYLLQKAGLDVVAVDNDYRGKDYWKHKWFPVRNGDETILKDYPDHTLFLCWPEMSGVSSDALANYQGRTLIYVGEGRGGCTANEKFFEELNCNWQHGESVNIPQWPGIHDYLQIYHKQTL
jgi:hypothetical protein